MSAEQNSSIPDGPLKKPLEEIEHTIARLENSSLDNTERLKMLNQISSGCLAVHAYGQEIKRGGTAPDESILDRNNFSTVVEVFNALNMIQSAPLDDQVIKRLMELSQKGRTENKCTNSYK